MLVSDDFNNKYSSMAENYLEEDDDFLSNDFTDMYELFQQFDIENSEEFPNGYDDEADEPLVNVR